MKTSPPRPGWPSDPYGRRSEPERARNDFQPLPKSTASSSRAATIVTVLAGLFIFAFILLL
jgi:hypothetical protein